VRPGYSENKALTLLSIRNLNGPLKRDRTIISTRRRSGRKITFVKASPKPVNVCSLRASCCSNRWILWKIPVRWTCWARIPAQQFSTRPGGPRAFCTTWVQSTAFGAPARGEGFGASPVARTHRICSSALATVSRWVGRWGHQRRGLPRGDGRPHRFGSCRRGSCTEFRSTVQGCAWLPCGHQVPVDSERIVNGRNSGGKDDGICR
jgi:hypothetical protein